MTTIAPVVRKLMRPLRHTPLHPQWFACREGARIAQWVHKGAIGRVLDVGCADGSTRELISPDCNYVGLDYPVTANGLYGTRPDVFADGASLPFADASFDSVLLLEVLEHVRFPDRVLVEAARVRKPGGRLLLSMPFLYPLHDAPHDYQRYTAPGLVSALATAGLVPDTPRARNPGFEASGMLQAIACADAILSALKERRWRLVFAPLLVVAIPLINIASWAVSGLSGSDMIAGGYVVDACCP